MLFAFFTKMLFAFFIVVLAASAVHSKGDVKEITEDTWTDMLVGEWMVEFYAPWCPACHMLEKSWKEFASWSEDLGIEVAAVDITTNPALSGRFAITALPTIFHVKDGVFRQYTSAKRKEDFISFIEESKWNELDPIPAWKSPKSFHMSLVASFFKLSMMIRVTHNSMVEFGIPYWASYIIFGLGTIVLGTCLGLFVVFFIDYIHYKRTEDQSVGEVEQDATMKEKEMIKKNTELQEIMEEGCQDIPGKALKGDTKPMPGGVFPVEESDSGSDTEIDEDELDASGLNKQFKREMDVDDEGDNQEMEGHGDTSLRKRKD